MGIKKEKWDPKPNISLLTLNFWYKIDNNGWIASVIQNIRFYYALWICVNDFWR